MWLRNLRLWPNYMVPFCTEMYQSENAGYGTTTFGSGTQLLIIPSKSDLQKCVASPPMSDLHFYMWHIAWSIIEYHYFYYDYYCYYFIIIDHNNDSLEYISSAILFFFIFKGNQCQGIRRKFLHLLWSLRPYLLIQFPALCWAPVRTSQCLGVFPA